MDLRSAVLNCDALVIATDKFWGTYIGIMEKVDKIGREFKARVRILDILQYPSQMAELQKSLYRRKPHVFHSVQQFNLESIEFYPVEVEAEFFTESMYRKSVISVLKNELNKYGVVDAREKEILLDHLDEYQYQQWLKRPDVVQFNKVIDRMKEGRCSKDLNGI
jgi:hypothetical protein